MILIKEQDQEECWENQNDMQNSNPFRREIWLINIFVGYYEIVSFIRLRLDSVIANDLCIWLLYYVYSLYGSINFN